MTGEESLERGIKWLPLIISTADESADPREAKQAEVLGLIKALMGTSEAFEAGQIRDAERFDAGLAQVIAGIFACRDASVLT